MTNKVCIYLLCLCIRNNNNNNSNNNNNNNNIYRYCLFQHYIFVQIKKISYWQTIKERLYFLYTISPVRNFGIFARLSFLTKKENICPFTSRNSTFWLSNLKSNIFFKTNKQTKINKSLSFYSSYKLGRNIFLVCCKQVNKVYFYLNHIKMSNKMCIYLRCLY